MRRKAELATPSQSPAASRTPGNDLREELERLGLAPEHAEPLADQLERLATALPTREYRALLDGVLLAQRAKSRAASQPSNELHRLLQDFAVELKKLDEGLQLLASYLVRIRDQTSGESRHVLH